MSYASFEAVFRKYDRNGDGYLDKSELGSLMRDLGSNPTASDIVVAMAQMDISGDGKIDCDELKHWYSINYMKSDGSRLNKLLVKPVTGRAAPGTYDLPPATHTYGMPYRKDPEGAGKVVSGWSDTEKTPKASPAIDIVKMNKIAASKGIVTAKGFREFEANNKKYKAVKEGKKMTRDPIKTDIVFGAPNEPSTPVSEVLGTGAPFSVDFDERMYIGTLREEEIKTKPALKKPKPTLASEGRKRALEQKRIIPTDTPMSPKTDMSWKMKKFSSVPSKVTMMLKAQECRRGETPLSSSSCVSSRASITSGSPRSHNDDDADE